MSITRSDVRNSKVWYWIDEFGFWHHERVFRNFNLADYEMRRLGKKDYGFFLNGLVARYSCSYLEARRRFVMKLITARMGS